MKEKMEININLTKIGETLRAKREQFGYSQEDIAEIAGVSRNYYGRIERGEAETKLTVYIKICTVLQLTMNDLIGKQLDKHGINFALRMADLTKDFTPAKQKYLEKSIAMLNEVEIIEK